MEYVCNAFKGGIYPCFTPKGYIYTIYTFDTPLRANLITSYNVMPLGTQLGAALSPPQSCTGIQRISSKWAPAIYYIYITILCTLSSVTLFISNCTVCSVECSIFFVLTVVLFPLSLIQLSVWCGCIIPNSTCSSVEYSILFHFIWCYMYLYLCSLYC